MMQQFKVLMEERLWLNIKLKTHLRCAICLHSILHTTQTCNALHEARSGTE